MNGSRFKGPRLLAGLAGPFSAEPHFKRHRSDAYTAESEQRRPALLPGKWITCRESGLRRGKKCNIPLGVRSAPRPASAQADRTLPSPPPRSPAPYPPPRPGGGPRGARFHRPLHARSPCTLQLQPEIGHVRPGPRLGPSAVGAPQGCSGDRGVPISVPPRPVKKSGQRWRERAARPLPTGGSATVGCGRRLCCIRGCALRSAQPRSDPEPARAAFPSSAAAARRAAPRGETRVRSSFPGLTDFRGRRISPRSLRASRPRSPSSRDAPTPWARARTLTHTPTRRRACARPRAPSRGVSSAPRQSPLSGAATHTGFQPPRGVLRLRQRRRRRRRERQLQPGPVSQLRARDGVREKRGRRTPRRARRPAPRGGLPPLPVPRPQVSSSGARSIPGASGIEAWVPGSRPRHGTGTEAPGGSGLGGGERSQR